MLKSMTGFGRFESGNEDCKLTVELKSVNHRYLETTVKMPKSLCIFESAIRNVLKEYISRGKVDVFITYEDYTEGRATVRYNEDIAREYYDGLMKMSEDFQIPNDVKVSLLSRFPDVFTVEEQKKDEDKVWSMLSICIRNACEKFVETRVKEGEHLKNDLVAKLDHMTSLVDIIRAREPEIVSEYRKKLVNKVNELLGDTKIDDTLLAAEITLYADKICTDEETVRLKAHIDHMYETLQHGENIGRKLDFIAQEMNREANTILSKANDLAVSNTAIDLKTEIEKIREQIQNIE